MGHWPNPDQRAVVQPSALHGRGKVLTQQQGLKWKTHDAVIKLKLPWASLFIKNNTDTKVMADAPSTAPPHLGRSP